MTGRAPDLLALGLGGNIGTEEEIRARFTVVRDVLRSWSPLHLAPLYRTAPIGPDQPPFMNTVIALRPPAMEPPELLANLHEIEHQLGRRRESEARWGPRTIDLDVLVWGLRVIDTPELRVPHPRLGDRRFALAPLMDIVGEAYEVPGLGRLGDALARVRDQPLEMISEVW